MEKNKLTKFDLLVRLIVKVNKDDIFSLASQLAYHLMLSFFPFLIFLMTLVGRLDLSESAVLDGLERLLPTSVFQLTETIVSEVIRSQNTGLLGISIVVAVWSASSGFRGVIKGINKAYNIEEKRGLIRRTIVAIISTIGLAAAILSALVLLVFGSVIGNFIISKLPLHQLTTELWMLLRRGVLIFALIFVFAAIYKFSPSMKLKWKEVVPGAIVSALGWLLVSALFSFYINNYANYSRVYGSLAAVFILMIWLFLTSLIFIFGVEMNSVLRNRNKIKK